MLVKSWEEFWIMSLCVLYVTNKSLRGEVVSAPSNESASVDLKKHPCLSCLGSQLATHSDVSPPFWDG